MITTLVFVVLAAAAMSAAAYALGVTAWLIGVVIAAPFTAIARWWRWWRAEFVAAYEAATAEREARARWRRSS